MSLLPHRVAFFVVGFVLLGALTLMPFALAGVVEEVAQTANPTIHIFGNHQQEEPARTLLNLNVRALDEWQRQVTVQVSGHRVCGGPCSETDRVQFVSVPLTTEDGEGLPPYATIAFAPSVRSVTQDITLPVSGDAIRYPFDQYRLRLATVLQHVAADGGVQTIAPEQAKGRLFLSINGSIPRAVMNPPALVDLHQVFVDDPAWSFVSVSDVTFQRPVYLKIVSVLLVLLISAAAAYAVFMHPLRELVMWSGALILGVWGIRAVVLGSNVPGFTAIDLALIVVIMFLLFAISWRALLFLHARGELPRPLPVGASDPSQSEPPDPA